MLRRTLKDRTFGNSKRHPAMPTNFNPLAAISARHGSRLRFPPYLQGPDKPPRREAVAREVRVSLPRGPFYPCLGKISTNQHFRRLSWQCVQRQPDFHGECIRQFGKGLQRRRVPSGAASTCETFDRDGRRLLRESGIPLGPVGPILLSPAGGTMRHGRRSVPQAASRIPLHRSCSRQRPAPLSLAAREKDALPYFPSLGLRSPTVKG